MQLNPIFQFNNTTETGIDQVPVNAKVLILDDGTGQSKEVIKISKGSMNSSTTIADFLNDSNLHDVAGAMGISQLFDVDYSTPATNGQVLKYNLVSAKWIPSDDSDTDTTYSAGTGLSLTGTTFALNSGIDGLTDVDTNTSAPTNSQGLVYNGSDWVPEDLADKDKTDKLEVSSTLTDAASVTPDLDTALNFTLSCTQNFTLENPKIAIWITAYEILVCIHTDYSTHLEIEKIKVKYWDALVQKFTKDV